jgi:hypothetical protein
MLFDNTAYRVQQVEGVGTVVTGGVMGLVLPKGRLLKRWLSGCLSRNHAIEDAIKARLGSVCPGGTAVPAVLSGRDGRDPRTAGRLPVPPWRRATSLTK